MFLKEGRGGGGANGKSLKPYTWVFNMGVFVRVKWSDVLCGMFSSSGVYLYLSCFQLNLKFVSSVVENMSNIQFSVILLCTFLFQRFCQRFRLFVVYDVG